MKPTLLLAESDAELRDTYRALLRKLGFELETAADGLDCLEKLRRAQPGVLVLDRDLLWGGADGVLAWLREQGDSVVPPVILTATVCCPPDAPADVEPPVVKVLSKPFSLAALLEGIRTAVAEQGSEAARPGWCCRPCRARPRLRR
jgi:DNA-binding response OmpR family regulator